VGLNLRIGVLDLRLLSRGLRIPEIDVQALDLLDPQADGLTGRAKIVVAVGIQTRAPGAELLDLGLIQTIAQRSPLGSRSQCTTAPRQEKRPQARCNASRRVRQEL
jgi:hypothetical protein